MAFEARKIPELLFWVVMLGITVFVASKVVGQIGGEVTKIFK